MIDDFLLRALIAGVVIALAAAPLACLVVWRRMAYFGDATGHAGILGVALGLALGLVFQFRLAKVVYWVCSPSPLVRRQSQPACFYNPYFEAFERSGQRRNPSQWPKGLPLALVLIFGLCFQIVPNKYNRSELVWIEFLPQQEPLLAPFLYQIPRVRSRVQE